jgi:hypothetical protein
VRVSISVIKSTQLNTPSRNLRSMKLKLALFFASIMTLALSSCTVYTGPNGLPFGAGFQPIVVGTGMSPRGPIGGTLIASGSVVGGLCGPRGPFVQGGFQTHPLHPQWGNVYPNNAFGGHGCIPQPAPCRASPRGAPWQYPRNYQGSHYIRPGIAGPGGSCSPPVIFY